jgi:hypothetical protein
MRRPVRLAASLAVVVGALVVAGPIAAPALAGHANVPAASPRWHGSDHARSMVMAWKKGEWASEQRPAEAWRKGSWVSHPGLAKSCAKVATAWKGNRGSARRSAGLCATVSPGSVVRTAPVRVHLHMSFRVRLHMSFQQGRSSAVVMRAPSFGR